MECESAKEFAVKIAYWNYLSYITLQKKNELPRWFYSECIPGDKEKFS
jgi:hypothetical protein